MNPDIQKMGAVGDGRTKNTAAIQKAIDACAAAGGGRVVIPAGVFVTGTLELKDRVDLHLGQGATLLASADPQDYTKAYNAPYDNGFPFEGTYGFHLITAWKKTAISISGRGTIDGNGPAFFGPPVSSPIKASVWDRTNRWRPGQLVGLLECTAVRIDGVTFRNSPYWTIWPYACREVVITGVTIRNDWQTPNGDGIDPDCCENVVISDCDIQAGDDAIALRADRAYSGQALDLQNVTITNCLLSTPLGGLRFGPTGDLSAIRNVTVSNCVIQADCGLLFAQSVIKGYWEQGVLIENIRISNLIIQANAALVMNLHPFGKPAGFRNIAISHVTATGGGCYFEGTKDGVFENITVTDLTLVPHHLATIRCRHTLAANLIQIRQVGSLSLRHVRIDLGGCAPDSEGAVLHCEQVGSLTVDSVEVTPRPGRQERGSCKSIGTLRLSGCDVPIDTEATVGASPPNPSPVCPCTAHRGGAIVDESGTV